jgi:diguanylate cyclase (GGDEF)-like protein/PAS domain S-box-containing protein
MTLTYDGGPRLDWRSFVAALPDGVAVIDDAGTIVDANDSLLALSGYEASELVGTSIHTLVPEARRERHERVMSTFLASPSSRTMGQGRDFAMRRRDASVIYVDISLAHVRAHDREWVVASVRDVSAVRESRVRLERLEQRFRLAFENSMAPMIFTDLDDRVIAANDAFCSMLGRTREEVMHRDSQSFTHPDDRGITEGFHRRLVVGDEDRVRYVKRYVHRDGHEIVVEVLKAPARDEDGTVLYYVISERDITEESELTAMLTYQALHDPLTGLANRFLIENRLIQAKTAVARYGGLGAVILVDLDDFKGVNDTLGHLAGDELLRAVAARLSSVAREVDTLCRFGGDEFLYLAERLNGLEDARRIAERLRSAFDEPFSIAETSVVQRVSVGAALWGLARGDGEKVIEHADVALYRAKRDGKHRVVLYEETEG